MFPWEVGARPGSGAEFFENPVNRWTPFPDQRDISIPLMGPAPHPPGWGAFFERQYWSATMLKSALALAAALTMLAFTSGSTSAAPMSPQAAGATPAVESHVVKVHGGHMKCVYGPSRLCRRCCHKHLKPLSPRPVLTKRCSWRSCRVCWKSHYRCKRRCGRNFRCYRVCMRRRGC